MPPVELECAAPIDRVFAVLSEPRRYESWVVGAHDVGAADPHWPAPGATFHHEQGLPFLNLEDTSTVLASEPPVRLVMEVRARPLLVAVVDLRLTAQDGGTRVWMEEVPVGGLLAPLLRRRRAQTLVRARNRESLRRLCGIAQGGD